VRLKQAQEALSEKEKTLVELRKENELAKKRLEEMSTNEYIEKQLRDNLMDAKGRGGNCGFDPMRLL